MILTMKQPKLRTITTIQEEKKLKEKKKAFLKIVLILSLLVTAAFAIMCFAEADMYTDKMLGTWNLGELKNNYAAFIFMLVYFVYGGLPGMLASVNIWTINPDAAYFEFFSSVTTELSSVGIGLGVIWVMLDLIEKAQMDQMTPEVIIRWGIKLITMVMIVSNTSALAKGIIGAANDITQKVVKVGSGGESSAVGTLYNELKTAGFIRQTTIMLEVLIPAIAIIVCFVIMLALIYSRIIEVGIRMCFMPIGVSDAFTHGINSPGMRYIKKFFAVCLQSAVLFMILFIGLQIMAGTAAGGPSAVDGLQNAGAGIFSYFAAPADSTLIIFFTIFGWLGDIVVMIAMIGAMLKSQQIVNDIAGV